MPKQDKKFSGISPHRYVKIVGIGVIFAQFHRCAVRRVCRAYIVNTKRTVGDDG